LLVPVAVKTGLPPMLGAMALAFAGQGMALSGDVIIQGAPGLTAKAAGISEALATQYGGILSIITGITAIVLGYLMTRHETMLSPSKTVRLLQGIQRISAMR